VGAARATEMAAWRARTRCSSPVLRPRSAAWQGTMLAARAGCRASWTGTSARAVSRMATAAVSGVRAGHFRAPPAVTAGPSRRDAAASEAPHTPARQEVRTRHAPVSIGARVRRSAPRPMRPAFQHAAAALPPARGATLPGACARPVRTPCARPLPTARAHPTRTPARRTATARPAIVRTADAIRMPTETPAPATRNATAATASTTAAPQTRTAARVERIPTALPTIARAAPPAETAAATAHASRTCRVPSAVLTRSAPQPGAWTRGPVLRAELASVYEGSLELG
jgi:hypothetical protein